MAAKAGEQTAGLQAVWKEEAGNAHTTAYSQTQQVTRSDRAQWIEVKEADEFVSKLGELLLTMDQISELQEKNVGNSTQKQQSRNAYVLTVLRRHSK